MLLPSVRLPEELIMHRRTHHRQTNIRAHLALAGRCSAHAASARMAPMAADADDRPRFSNAGRRQECVLFLAFTADYFDLWVFRRTADAVEYLLVHTSQEKADRFFGGGRFWQIPTDAVRADEHVADACRRLLKTSGVEPGGRMVGRLRPYHLQSSIVVTMRCAPSPCSPRRRESARAPPSAGNTRISGGTRPTRVSSASGFEASATGWPQSGRRSRRAGRRHPSCGCS